MAPVAPKGGFKIGGWYDGYQFDGSGFSQARGVESIGSNAGVKVSAEVNSQSDKAQGLATGTIQKFVDQPATPSGGIPKVDSADQATDYLNKFQTSMYDDSTLPEGGSSSVASLTAKLAPAGGAPELLNRTGMLDELRTKYNIGDLETSLNDLKTEARTIQAEQRARTQNEEGKAVPLGVIGGRVTEITRQENEKLDFVNRQIATINDELTTKYSVVQTIINFAGLDYNDAVEKYSADFNRNIQIYGLIQTEKNDARDAARANLQIMQNSIIKGNTSFASLDPSTQAMISKLEVQSGLPVGFTASLKADANANIIFSNTNNGVTQVGFKNADGTISVKSYGTPTGGGSETDKKRSYTNSAVEDASNGVTLKDMLKIYSGYLEPNDIYNLYNTNSIYGAAKSDSNNGGWTAEELAKYGIKPITT
jgi:hypothetical protein